MGRRVSSRRLPTRPAVACAARSLSAVTTLSVLSALSVLSILSVLSVSPARAASAADVLPRQPPPGMSAVGGARLALSGVQADPGGAPPPPESSALAWMVSDGDTGQVLAAKNAHWPLPPASTLKTLFADTLLPRLAADTVHRVSTADLRGLGTGSSLVGIQAGQSYKVSDLWLGVLLCSGNDAVHTLAAMSGGIPATVGAMQERATALGAHDTHVVSPDGYDAPGQLSSAYDLTLFLRDALTNPDFTRYSATRVARFPGGRNAEGAATPSFQIQNTNRLLAGTDGVARYPGLIAGKNGYTAQAGNTLVSAASQGGHTLIVALLNPRSGKTNAVYDETRRLLDWGFAARSRVTAVGALADPPGGPAGGGTGADPPGRIWPAVGWAAAVVLPAVGWAVVCLRRGRGRGRGRG